MAEYWSHEVDKLQTYIDQVEGKTMLFDAPLQMKFHEASRMGRDYDMTQIFTGTLVEADPSLPTTTPNRCKPSKHRSNRGLNRWRMP